MKDWHISYQVYFIWFYSMFITDFYDTLTFNISHEKKYVPLRMLKQSLFMYSFLLCAPFFLFQ